MRVRRPICLVATWCAARGGGACNNVKARMQPHLSCALSLHLQARILYHEASLLEGMDPGRVASSTQGEGSRLGLLRRALDAVSAATTLCPASASCAALRATCVVNVLVEESSALEPQAEGGGGGGLIKADLAGAMEACRATLATPSPTHHHEPIISISDGRSTTVDPCCLVRMP